MRRIHIAAVLCVCGLALCPAGLFAQQGESEVSWDLAANSVALPRIFWPAIDVSGRGAHRQQEWPQGLASAEALDAWGKDIGFGGIYRLQLNLWEISELAKDKEALARLLSNYEGIMKKVTDSGGAVILNIFGTPAGLGKVLDKKSPPWNLKAFKELVKGYIREFSCNKRYNVWYEVWSAPDLDDFFLGRQQEYLALYRTVAESIQELEAETKVHIPIGGPSVSWWFQDLDGNTLATPERSLIYQLIRRCSRYRLPLDFISWHAYSSDPQTEKAVIVYKKTAIELMRDWLSYFKLDPNIPLIVSEWNFDNGLNVCTERDIGSHVLASFILARLKNMREAGLDYQFYYSLEDFQNNKDGVVRNVGVFWFDANSNVYRGGPKTPYQVFKILGRKGTAFLQPQPKLNDDFLGVIALKSPDEMTLLLYSYADPSLALNFLSRNIYSLREAERRILRGFVKQNLIEGILSRQIDLNKLRATKRLRSLLKKAQELQARVKEYAQAERQVTLVIKNIKENYLYQRFSIDSSCGLYCELPLVEEKQIGAQVAHKETLPLKPYSVNIIVLRKAPAPVTQETKEAQEAAADAGRVSGEAKQQVVP